MLKYIQVPNRMTVINLIVKMRYSMPWVLP